MSESRTTYSDSRLARLLGLCLLVWSCLPVTAQVLDSAHPSNLDSLASRFRLDEVEVVARQNREILPPQKLEGAQLQALSTNSVADAVRYFSGVQIKDYGGIGGLKTVDIRSMGSHHLGVFYDGVEIGNAQNGTVDLGKFSMDNLEELALYNGQKSDIFQSAKDFGSAGTLYLKTRQPRFQAGQTDHLVVKMKAGAFSLANPSVLYERKLINHLSLTANAEYTYSSGKYNFRYRRNFADGTPAWDTTAVRQNGDIQSIRAEAGLYGFGEMGETADYKWNIRAYHYQCERGIPGAIVNNVWHNWQRQWDRNSFVQGHTELTFDRRWSLMASAKYSNDGLRYLNPDPSQLYVDNTYLQQEVYASVATKCRIFPIWDVAIAADYQFNTLNTNAPLIGHPIRHTVLASVATAVSYQWLKVQASLLNTYVSDIRTNALTPSVFVNVKPLRTEEFYLRAFYKDNQRMPTFNDLYYGEMGSTDLKPEHSRQYDLGGEWTKNYRMARGGCKEMTIGLKADAYFNQVRNKIIAVPKGNSQYRWAMMNLGYVEIWGVELSADYQVVLPKDVVLNIHSGYTWTQALDRTNPRDNDPYFGTYGGQIAYIPRHSCSATGTMIWRGLNVAYSFIYVGERYTSSSNIRPNRVQPWYTHDLSASYTWKLPVQNVALRDSRIQLGVEVNNLFHQQYEVIPNYPMPGIHGNATLKYLF